MPRVNYFTRDSKHAEYGFDEDFLTAVMRGRVDGVVGVAIQGQRANMQVNTAYDMHPTGNFVLPTTLQTLSVVSSSANDTAAGTGARTVTISGLDANFLEITATVTMNGLTPVVVPTQFLRVNMATVATCGSLGWNDGNISITSGLGTLGYLPATYSRHQIAQYTVPANYSGLLVDLLMAQNTLTINGGGDWCTFQARTASEGGASQARLTITTTAGNPCVHVAPKFHGPVPTKATVSIRVPGCTAGMFAHCAIWLLLSRL